jgi:hypothetical protein
VYKRNIFGGYNVIYSSELIEKAEARRQSKVIVRTNNIVSSSEFLPFCSSKMVVEIYAHRKYLPSKDGGRCNMGP